MIWYKVDRRISKEKKKMVFSTIKFKNDEVLHNVRFCYEAPEIPGFIAVWIDNKVYYFNLDTISHLVMNEMYLERW